MNRRALRRVCKLLESRGWRTLIFRRDALLAIGPAALQQPTYRRSLSVFAVHQVNRPFCKRSVVEFPVLMRI